MNCLIVRTDEGEYRGGDIIYGAVYLNIIQPLFAEYLILIVEGQEKCSWSTETHPVSNEDNPPLATEAKENAANDEPIKESFEGSKKFLFGKYRIAAFEGGAVPIGTYIYPFKTPLKLDLPNSFKRGEFVDAVKETLYSCSVSYSISAKFTLEGKENTDLTACQVFNVITDLKSKRESFKHNRPKKRIESELDVCCCFRQGALILEAEVEKFTYKLGSKICMKYSIDNLSSSTIKQCVITLARIIKLVGKANQSEHVVNGFYEVVDEIVHDFELPKDGQLIRELLVPLQEFNNNHPASTTGDLVKCLYQVEVDVKVPWDSDCSLELPITVNMGTNHDFCDWEPPDWIKRVVIKKSLEPCTVPDRILLSKTFCNVPLPNQFGGI